jgi:hypothetical protein
VTCDDVQKALQSADPRALADARGHAVSCPHCRAELEIWDDISAAAKTLHREWDSPGLWPRIAAAMRTEDARSQEEPQEEPQEEHRLPWWRALRWQAVAAAVVVLAVLAPLAWLGWRSGDPSSTYRSPAPAGGEASNVRLLNEQALSEIERAEAEYIRAIDALSSTALAQIAQPPSPLLLSLRERLIVIDAAIIECRTAIERNRFNAHLRRELLSMYQEKQRTLLQILEEEKSVS